MQTASVASVSQVTSVESVAHRLAQMALKTLTRVMWTVVVLNVTPVSMGEFVIKTQTVRAVDVKGSAVRFQDVTMAYRTVMRRMKTVVVDALRVLKGCSVM